MTAGAHSSHPPGEANGPLADVRVLDITTAWSGPMATSLLADLGANVIRVELPGGQNRQIRPHLPGTTLSWFTETTHRNKSSVCLDLRTSGGQAVLRRLATTVDVLIENFRPGTMARWGLGFEDLCQVRPDLIQVSISGFGQTGRDASRAAYDPVIQATSGWMSLNGDVDGPPTKSPTFLTDDLAGLHAALAASAALHHRARTGEGQHIDVPMLDVLLFQSSGFLTLAAMGVPLPRMGDQTSFVVPSGVFACDDGHLYLVVALDKQWRAVAEAIGRPELATADGFARNDERVANRDAVNRVVAGWCAQRSTDEATSALQTAGAVAERVRTYHEVAADPSVRDRGLLVDTKLSDGSTAPLVANPVRFGATPTSIRHGAPEVGADTEQVLLEAGLSRAEIEQLRRDGVI